MQCNARSCSKITVRDNIRRDTSVPSGNPRKSARITGDFARTARGPAEGDVAMEEQVDVETEHGQALWTFGVTLRSGTTRLRSAAMSQWETLLAYPQQPQSVPRAELD